VTHGLWRDLLVTPRTSAQAEVDQVSVVSKITLSYKMSDKGVGNYGVSEGQCVR
jgi:hypothetical protein